MRPNRNYHRWVHNCEDGRCKHNHIEPPWVCTEKLRQSIHYVHLNKVVRGEDPVRAVNGAQVEPSVNDDSEKHEGHCDENPCYQEGKKRAFKENLDGEEGDPADRTRVSHHE